MSSSDDRAGCEPGRPRKRARRDFRSASTPPTSMSSPQDHDAELGKAESNGDNTSEADRPAESRIPDPLKTACKGNPRALAKLDTIPIFDGSNSPLHDHRVKWSSRVPQLFPICDCVIGEIPTYDALFQNVNSIKPRTKLARNSSDQPTTFQTLLTELSKPEPSHAYTAMNIDVKEGRKGWDMRPPNFQLEELEEHSILDGMTISLATKGGMVNFHVDCGMSGLAALAGSCRKFWIMAELNSHNFSKFLPWNRPGGEHKLADLLADLDHNVVMFEQTPDHVMYLPSGIIHATITLSGGILYGNNFLLRRDVHPRAMALIANLKDPGSDTVNVINRQFNLTKDVLNHGTEKEKAAALGWLCDHRIRTAATGAFKKEFRKMVRLWKTDLKALKEGEMLGPHDCAWIFV